VTRGRRPVYQNPYPVSLKCERELRDITQSLGISDPEVYARGVMVIARERAGELSEAYLHKIIQIRRREMQAIQEEIASLERIALDATIREQVRKKKDIETRIDDRGREYQVVMV